MASEMWEKFDEAFKGTSAYLIEDKGKMVARVVMQHRDQLRVWFHVYGFEVVVSAWTRGYGYDKHNAAMQDAVARLSKVKPDSYTSEVNDHHRKGLVSALGPKLEGTSWRHVLEHAGYEVHNVI